MNHFKVSIYKVDDEKDENEVKMRQLENIFKLLKEQEEIDNELNYPKLKMTPIGDKSNQINQFTTGCPYKFAAQGLKGYSDTNGSEGVLQDIIDSQLKLYGI